MSALTIEISQIRKTFGPTVALDGVSLRAHEGEVHAIIGGNGSGKSTLAKVISGALLPDKGQISIKGKSATTPNEARELGISNVFQEVLVADECSILDNLFLGSDGLMSFAGHREERYQRASELMAELVGFDIDVDTRVGELPLSLKQWVTIGRALLTNPKILILDESSAALDFDSTERLFHKMRMLKARGTTILFVTHRIAELVQIADRATVLRDGRDVGTLDKEEITEANILTLIAGAERKSGKTAQSEAQKLNDTALLRVADAKVWDDSGKVDFTLYPGEIVGVTGLDGQGQADFIRALAGVQPLRAGNITAVHDRVARAITNLRTARNNGVAYVSGDRKNEGIFANLSIFENLGLPVYREHRTGGWLNLISRTKLRPLFEWETEKLSVKMGSPQNLITSLSGGNQQKVLIARSFAERPSILVLNDPARGVDAGAKLDLYRNLRDFAARGNAVVFLSSELEEFINLCSRVLVFRNGSVSREFPPPFDSHAILNAMFGRRASAGLPGEEAPPDHRDSNNNPGSFDQPPAGTDENGRPIPRRVQLKPSKREILAMNQSGFLLTSPDFTQGGNIPERFAEDSKVSPPLHWSDAPEGTKSFALSVTDPDLPEEFNFPRSFAHWLVYNIPAGTRELVEGASRSLAMPAGAQELNSDFVTFGIPGFSKGWGGPWPPDRQHRYIFTLYALKVPSLTLADDADLIAFASTVTPVVIDQAMFTAVYGPARKTLPTTEAVAELTGGTL